MPNTNCLEHRCCPQCQQSDRFDINASATFRLVDDGTEYHGDVEYDEDSAATCPDCGWTGTWGQTDMQAQEPSARVYALHPGVHGGQYDHPAIRRMKTLLHEIEEMQKAIADPSTWTDERRALKEDIRERKERLAAAKVHAPLLLAIARDLAFGNEASYAVKVTEARKQLMEAGLLTFEECRQVRGETAEVVQAAHAGNGVSLRVSVDVDVKLPRKFDEEELATISFEIPIDAVGVFIDSQLIPGAKVTGYTTQSDVEVTS